MTIRLAKIFLYHNESRRRKTRHLLIRKEDVESRVQDQEEEEDEAPPPSPQELQYVRDIKRVLELLRKNRDILFSEVEAPVTNPGKFLYAKATDNGKDPKEAAKRLKIEWDSAAEIEYTGLNDEPAMGKHGTHYPLTLVTCCPRPRFARI
ncbi:PREDICTED: uncharacterized protein LOC105124121 isoform X5 [Populus euphratica]|uniref:Uncharacterized protein LOC105124121 isoform X5 n=1 Tax=Populus euphratica TaxID=75702 RepID=A0AAJ6XKH4_POPEU|nr:PREDICTED: uncharacterized protein LOC105124121 isoform X5 [Populus euphratica]